MWTLAITDFKAHALQVLGEVAETRESVLVAKRGKPLAEVIPFNPATSVQFVAREPQHVRIGVYDVRGRLVTELANRGYPIGRHAIEWNGRDATGRAVSSGMYLFRIELGGQVQVRKALLLK